MEFTKLFKAICGEISGRTQQIFARIEEAQEAREVARYLVKNATAATVARVEKMGLEKAKEKAKAYQMKQAEQEKLNIYAELESLSDVPTFESASLTIEWTKGGTYGNQAQATLKIHGFEIVEGSKTGGCGYDKESTAAAYALNASKYTKAALYRAEEKRLIECPEKSRRDALGYGSGYFGKPYYESGVGMSSIRFLLENMGYKVTCTGSGKAFDCYYIERQEENAQ